MYGSFGLLGIPAATPAVQPTPQKRSPAGPKQIRYRIMFKEALQGVVEGTDGGVAGLLMDFEGIPLESFSREESVFDIEAAAAIVAAAADRDSAGATASIVAAARRGDGASRRAVAKPPR